MKEDLRTVVARLRDKKPLILNITNSVSAGFVADGLLAIGASPVMIESVHEVHDMIKIADALVINIGTLDENFIKLSQAACHSAAHKIRILDPVGAGATPYRTDFCETLLHHHRFSIIRGNASEILALSGNTRNTRGVDSSIDTNEIDEEIKHLSRRTGAVVIASGKIDKIANGEQLTMFDKGSPLMADITGSGCLLSAVIAAFHTVLPDPFEASSAATLYYGLCGEVAAKLSKGPGSFKANFLDALSLFPGNLE